METLIIVGIIILALNLLLTIIKKKPTEKTPKEYPYTDKFILTKNEYAFYKELDKIATENKWKVCPKIGMKDLFTITDKSNYMKYFGAISQKHIDFLICDNMLKPIFAIELDDNSHNTAKAKASDEFKNKVFEKSKIKLIRIKADKEYSKEYIKRNLDIVLEKKEEENN